jgi:1-acyl-sn-glycerol-3-phosphate acyltransferase
MDLAPHLAAFLAGGPFEARVTFGAPIPFDAATDRKRATAKAEAAVRRAFHAAVIPGSPARDARNGGRRFRLFSILLSGRTA